MQSKRIIVFILATILASLRTLKADDVAVVRFWATDGQFPTCDLSYSPLGNICVTICNNQFVTGRLTITVDGETIYDSGEWDGASGGARIRVRGNSSALNEFPSYKLKLAKKYDIMGMGCKSKNWNLMSVHPLMPNRHGLLNNLVGYTAAAMVGMEWQPRYMYAELYINDDYRGIYMISDAVERADERMDIGKTGIIIENDAYWWKDGETHFRTDRQHKFYGYTFKYPENEVLTDSVVEETAFFMREFEDALYHGGDYTDHIAPQSMAAWMLAHDIIGTLDAGGSNMYLHRHSAEQPLLHAGPMWDFDTALEIETGFNMHHTTDFFYMPELFMSEDFVEAYKHLWEDIKDDILPQMVSLCDSLHMRYGNSLDKAVERSNQRRGEQLGTLTESAQHMQTFILKRVQWLESIIPTIDTPQLSNGTEDSRIFTPNGVFVCRASNIRQLRSMKLHKGVYIYTNSKHKGFLVF